MLQPIAVFSFQYNYAHNCRRLAVYVFRFKPYRIKKRSDKAQIAYMLIWQSS